MTQEVASFSNKRHTCMKIRPFIITMMLMMYPVLLQGAVEPKAIIEAKAAVINVAKDPESVRFRGVRIEKMKNGEWIKGEYNAKNSFGGYVGFSKFVYVTSDKHLILEEDMKKNVEKDLASRPYDQEPVSLFIYKAFFLENW